MEVIFFSHVYVNHQLMVLMSVWLLLSLVSLAMMLLAVETQVSDWCIFDLCIVSVIFVSVLLAKFVSEFSLLLTVC